VDEQQSSIPGRLWRSVRPFETPPRSILTNCRRTGRTAPERWGIAATFVLAALVLAGCGGTTDTSVSASVTKQEPSTTTSNTVVVTTTIAPPTTTEAQTTTTAAAAIELVGDDEFVDQAGEALALLGEDAPNSYAEVLIYITTIESVEAGSGMDVFTRTFLVGDETAYAPGYGEDDQVLWLAGTIVHDACHSRLYTDDQPYTGRDAELACLEDQLDALVTIDRSDGFEDYVQGLIEGVDDPQNAYWNDPNRHW